MSGELLIWRGSEAETGEIENLTTQEEQQEITGRGYGEKVTQKGRMFLETESLSGAMLRSLKKSAGMRKVQHKTEDPGQSEEKKRKLIQGCESVTVRSLDNPAQIGEAKHQRGDGRRYKQVLLS